MFGVEYSEINLFCPGNFKWWDPDTQTFFKTQLYLITEIRQGDPNPNVDGYHFQKDGAPDAAVREFQIIGFLDSNGEAQLNRLLVC